MINQILNTLIQLSIFTFIPFVWYVISYKKYSGFFKWIGLKRVAICDRKLIQFMIYTIVVFLLISIWILYIVKGIETATSIYKGMGIVVLPSAFIYAFITTALSEEILFRGFLLKRLSSKFGFNFGNGIQSLLFGSLHGAMFFSLVEIYKSILICVFTGLIAWCMGYVNEKRANGSIVPSWIIHGSVNLFSAILSMLSII